MFVWKYFLWENLMFICRWMKTDLNNRSLKALDCQTSSSGIFPLATLIISYHNWCIFKLYPVHICMIYKMRHANSSQKVMNGQTITGTMMKNTILLRNFNLSPKKTFKYQRWGSHKLAPNAWTFLSMTMICLLQQQDISPFHFHNYHVTSNTFEKMYLTV
jgi:hypothetical protein